jgi:hypothetical protein
MTTLFNRDGSEFSGTPEFNDAGKPVRYVPVACDRCTVVGGQRLWVRWIENGQPRSNTGFDCWTCSNTGVRGQSRERLYTAVELARVNKSAATRAARKAEAQRIAAEQAEVALAAKEAAFRTGSAEFIAKLETLEGDYWDGFKQSFYARREAPTERQIGLVEAEVAKRAANATSEFFGAVGEKITLTLKVERIVVLHSEFYGTNYITIARTPEGNVVTYKGLTDLGSVGETKTVKATVKDHTLYNNTRQTVIQRPKVL